MKCGPSNTQVIITAKDYHLEVKNSARQHNSPSILWGKPDNDDGLETTDEEDSGTKNVANKVFSLGLDLVLNSMSLFFLVFGVTSTYGLLLNLCGYGYHFDKEGFQVDTLQHMREENLFKREFQRMTSESQPPSSLPS